MKPRDSRVSNVYACNGATPWPRVTALVSRAWRAARRGQPVPSLSRALSEIDAVNDWSVCSVEGALVALVNAAGSVELVGGDAGVNLVKDRTRTKSES